MQEGLEMILRRAGLEAVVARQGSAFCVYFMDHCPRDWHDLAASHNNDFDQELRRKLISCGIYFFPAPTKQCSISFAHTRVDIESTLEKFETMLRLVSR